MKARENTLPGAPRRRRAGLLLWLALAGGIVAYVWQGPVAAGGFYAPQPNGFYGLLTDALLSGQTHLKVQPDPALQLLENPWAGNQGVPRLHDATYFDGKYYLYFSPVPALLVGAPWKLATGTFLSDGATATAGALAALVLGCLLLWRCWRLWFEDLPLLWLAGGLAAIGLATELIKLISTSSVYPVPITAAAACSMGAYLLLVLALRAGSARERLRWLAGASLLWGLVVACRPNHLFALPALGLAAACLIGLAARQHGLWSRETIRLAAAALLPVATVGTALAAYNYARFGSITEFGMTYQFAAGDQRLTEALDLRYLASNLQTYFFHPPHYSPYFPYLIPQAAGGGMLPVSPLVLLSFAWPLTLLHRPLRTNPAWVVLGLTMLLDFCLTLGSVSLLNMVNERYRGDFMPTGVLLALLTTGGLLAWSRERNFAPRTIRGLLGVLLGWTLVHTALVAVAHNGRQETLRPVARVANTVTALVERARDVGFGPLTATVRFAPGEIGRRESLVVSGAGQDVLYVWYSGENEIRFGFDHFGAGGPVSAPMPVDFSRDYRLEIDLGCFYPPAGHPLFAGWPESFMRLRQRRVRVSLDGVELLGTGSHFYPTHPWDRLIGRTAESLIIPAGFSGTLHDLNHAGIVRPAAASAANGGRGALSLTVRFPDFDHFKSEPLVSTGHQGAGDLVYVTYVGPGKLRFGHDSWNGGSSETNLVNYVPGEPQHLKISLPSLDFATRQPGVGRFILSYNDTILLADDRPYHPSDPAELVIGFNGCDSSAARMNFSGKTDRAEHIPPLSLPDGEFQSTPGPIRMVLRFPLAAPGRSEPLLVTGQTGAADVIYVQYVDSTHVRIGYDHWAKGGPLSEPIPVDYSATHVVEIMLGSLYPPDAGRPADRVEVRLNGQSVLQHQETAYPSKPAEITPGLNHIGASTCDAVFTGRILFRERLGRRATDGRN